jgi:hypothetical protein
MDDLVTQWIEEYRSSAEKWGAAAASAAQEGDLGTARTASRQAAKYARMVLELETNQREAIADPSSPAVEDPKVR